MARKKSAGKKKQPPKSWVKTGEKTPGDDEQSPLAFLQNMFGGLSDDERLGLLDVIAGVAPDDVAMVPPTKGDADLVDEAYDLLEQAGEQPTVREALPLLTRAEGVARRALGKKPAQFIARHPDDEATHAFQDVKQELIVVLNAAGQSEAAISHAEEALQLDPNDMLGARQLLLAAYFNLGRLDDAQKLLADRCPEPWATWHFGRLLLSLRRNERGPEVDRRLKQAHVQNPHLLSLLLGERMPDPNPPQFVESGSDSEAQEYAQNYLPAWKETPGAVSWLREAAGRLNLEIGRDDFEEPPLLSSREIAALPPHDVPVWIVGIHQLPPLKMLGEGRAKKRWLLFALSNEGPALGFDFSDRKPSHRDLWQHLVSLMAEGEQPGKPQTLLVYSAPLLAKLRSQAKGTGIQLAAYEHEEQLLAMLMQISERLQGGALAAKSVDAAAIAAAPLDPDEVWEATLEELPQRIEVGGQSLRPTIVLVMSRSEGAPLWHELLVEPPAPDLLASAVRMAITRPAAGPPRRPRQVFVRHSDDLLALQPLADEAGFVCEIGQNLELIDQTIAELSEQVLGGGPQVALTDIEDITHAELEQFFVAAAAFYRGQPWKRFAMDEVVGLDQTTPVQPRRYALVMGQSGLTEGLAVYDRLQPIQNAFAATSDADMIDEADGFSVMYNEECHAPPADLDACEQFGWPVATPEAFPMAIRVRPGGKTELPTAAELRMLTAALTGITRLAKSSDKQTTVSDPALSLQITRLGWVGELDEAKQR